MKTNNQNVVKSILKLTLLVGILFAFSCSTEPIIESESSADSELLVKKPNPKARPMKGKITNAPADGVAPLICITPIGPIPITTNDLFGNVTHIGKLQDGSLGIPLTCELYDINTFTLRITYLIIYVSPNGDELYGESEVLVTPDPLNFDNGTFTGGVIVSGGTGKFENATGSWDYVDASYIGSTSSWEIEGEITY